MRLRREITEKVEIIHHHKWRGLQKKCHRCIAALRGASSRAGNTLRRASRGMWASCIVQSTRSKGVSACVFLAKVFARRRQHSKKGKWGPEIRQGNTPATISFESNSHHLAL